MSALQRFGLLTADALRDGLRNRVGLFAIAGALLVGLFADRCTGFGSGTLVMNGREVDLSDSARLVGPLVYGICTLMLVLIAGFLACDALARPTSERTAALWLSRPVSRGNYALSRLAGALALAVGAGAIVLLVVTALLHLRLGLVPAPAFVGLAIFVADAWVVAAVAMTLGLVLPRVVALATVTLFTQLVVIANGLHSVADTSGGFLGALERFGPPLGTALLYALAPWFASEASFGQWIDVVARLLFWGVGSSAVLVVLFRRLDLSS